MSTICTIENKQAYSHNFNTDDNSTFLTLINQILVITKLMNNSLHEQDPNLAILTGYINNMRDILDDITISEDSFIVDSDKFYNNTIMATVVANLADEVLRKYGSALGVPSNIMLTMDFERVINHSAHFLTSSTGQNLSTVTPRLIYRRTILSQ